MVWIRIDDQIAHHPKFFAAGPVAAWLWVCGNGYCNKYLTDGFIPTASLRALGNVPHVEKQAEVLVKVGLWDRESEGFRVHDFHDYNPTAAEVRAKRERDRVRKESARTPTGLRAVSDGIPDASRARVPSRPVPTVPDPIPGSTQPARFNN